MNIAAIYSGSDAEATKALYAELERRGEIGVIALNLLRACKASARAKVYRGGNSHGRFKDQAYKKKEWSLRQLCEALVALDDGKGCSTPGCGFPDGRPCIGCNRVVSHGVVAWGWKEDPAQTFHRWVLYVDLLVGQVSFHAAMPIPIASLNGGFPPYKHEWDGQHQSAERIIRYAECVLNGEPFPIEGAPLTTPADTSDRTDKTNAFDDRAVVQAGLFI